MKPVLVECCYTNYKDIPGTRVDCAFAVTVAQFFKPHHWFAVRRPRAQVYALKAKGIFDFMRIRSSGIPARRTRV